MQVNNLRKKNVLLIKLRETLDDNELVIPENLGFIQIKVMNYFCNNNGWFINFAFNYIKTNYGLLK